MKQRWRLRRNLKCYSCCFLISLLTRKLSRTIFSSNWDILQKGEEVSGKLINIVKSGKDIV